MYSVHAADRPVVARSAWGENMNAKDVFVVGSLGRAVARSLDRRATPVEVRKLAVDAALGDMFALRDFGAAGLVAFDLDELDDEALFDADEFASAALDAE